MEKIVAEWIKSFPGVSGYEFHFLMFIKVLVATLVAFALYFIAKRFVANSLNKFVSRTKSTLDDVFLTHRIFDRLALFVPLIFLYKIVPWIWGEQTNALTSLSTTLLAIGLVLLFAMVVDSIINAVLEVYSNFPISKQVPIHSFGQVAKLLVYFLALILVVSLVIGESPLKLFAGLGAMTAVLMLVFKDPILGFVAGLQLSYNKMVRIGDWVEVPQHKADGDIMEIGLTTVKVRNFDNTITTLPTQALINDSFKNWRGMQESPGRRIKRAIYIDMNSISFCTPSRLERYGRIDYIKDYIDGKQKELSEHNALRVHNQESKVNGRHITNIGTFRAYILAYLKNHPRINQDLTILVRQLAPTAVGLPLEVYAFCSDKNWLNYEAIQSDIFDHLFAVSKEFDLALFQNPSGTDFRSLGASGST